GAAAGRGGAVGPRGRAAGGRAGRAAGQRAAGRSAARRCAAGGRAAALARAAETGGYALASAGEYRPVAIAPRRAAEGAAPTTGLAFASPDADPKARAARLYFSVDPMGQKLAAIEPWAPGEEPRLEGAEAAPAERAPAAAGEIKLAALPPAAQPGGAGRIIDAPVERADLPPLPPEPGAMDP